MYIENAEQLNSKSILDEDVFHEILEAENEFEREHNHVVLRARAKELGVTKPFDDLYAAMKREYAKVERIERMKNAQVVGSGLTDFDFLDEQFRCGEWTATDDGIAMVTDMGPRIVCPHPILPVKILKNAETGKYKVELMFKIRDKIRHIFVDRETIASPSKILALANDSVQVTSNTAALLVQYLADVERYGSEDGRIKEYTSTSRLGWIEDIDENGNRTKYFLPYEKEIIFDNEMSMKVLFDSIKHHGKKDAWYKLIKEIRAKKQNEVLINLAASFASVLVDVCGALPFIVSLWGGSGIGKTVILKICTSVWADPGEGKYITDAKATTTAMEMRLNILNSLPMTLDDMAQIQYQDDNFSSLIYRWCAGKGRDRSNKELGLNKLTSWRNCTITNGERSLVDESTQGGAVNRVLDIEASGEKLFDGASGSRTSKIVESNFGFAGEEFIQVIKKIGAAEIQKIVNKYYAEIMAEAEKQDCKKEDKQVNPMALILAADELTEQYLFNDGVRLDVAECCKYLKNQEDASEGIRAYEYLIGTVIANKYHFEDEGTQLYTRWGFFQENYVVIFSTEFERIMSEKFQGKAFLSWAKKNDLLKMDKNGTPKKVIKYDGKSIRAVVIRMDFLEESTENGDYLDALEEDMPFK